MEVSLEQEDHLVEDQETSVTCRVEGGQPRPEIGFMLMADEQTKIEVSSGKMNSEDVIYLGDLGQQWPTG